MLWILTFLFFAFPVSLICVHIYSISPPPPLSEHWKLSETNITNSTYIPRQVSCKIKLSYQKSSQLPTAVTHVSEPVLLILFPFWLREEPYSEQSTFLSAWPRFTLTGSWNVYNILPKYKSNMRGVTAVLYTCHSSPNSSLFFIFPLGFSVLQTMATRPVTPTVKSRLFSEICMLPRKLEWGSQASNREQRF